MKLSLKADTTSKSIGIFIQDSSKIDGSGLPALVFNTSNLIAYWWQPGVTAPAAITLATLSTITSAYSNGGFKEADATHTPGDYRLDIPNACLTGATSVIIALSGAANMAPVRLEIELTAWDNQDAVHGGLSALPNAAAAAAGGLPTIGVTIPNATAGAAGGLFIAGSNAATSAPTFTTHIVGTVDTLTTYTGNTPQTGDAYARLGAPAGASVSADIAAIKSDTGTILTDVNTGAGAIYTRLGSPSGASIAADIASVKSSVGSVTGNVGGNVTGTVGGMTAAGLALFFTVDSTETYSGAVDGSVVKEIASNAASGGDPWATSLPGAYSSGQAGYIVGTNLNATISSRSTYAGGAVASVTGNVGGNVTGTIGGLTVAALAMFFTVDTTKVFADAIGGSVVKEMAGGSGSDPLAVQVPGSYVAGTVGYIIGNRLDASITSRSTYAGTDTPGVLTLLSRIGGAITINGGAVAIDWAHVANPTTTVALTGTTISPAQVVASVSGNVVGTIGGLTTAALAQFFTVNTGETYGGAVGGSIVHEIAANSTGSGGSGLTAADVWSYATRTLTSLGATAPAGWIDAASIVDGALDGKGDWSTYAGGDTAGVTTLLSRIGAAITINGSGGVNVNLAQPLSSARALDSVGDTSLTLNDGMHCAIAGAAGQRVEDKNALTYVQKTPFTATVLRTFSIDSAAAPTRRT